MRATHLDRDGETLQLAPVPTTALAANAPPGCEHSSVANASCTTVLCGENGRLDIGDLPLVIHQYPEETTNFLSRG